MRKQLLLLAFLLLFTAVLTTAQATDTAVPAVVPLDKWPSEYFSAGWQPVELEAVDGPAPAAVETLGAASDTCGVNSVEIPVNGEAGGLTNVSLFTSLPTDPNIRSCMWGSPPSDRGYRSAWYRLVAPASGQLIVDTSGSNYDTVVAIHTGGCASLSLVSCNDDYVGLTSRAVATVQQGQVYHIEVVDWRQEAPSGGVILNLTAGIVSESKWQQIGLMAAARSRHMAVAVGPYLYVLGGQAYDQSGGVIRIRDMSRFDTRTQTWETMPSMPHVCGGESPDSGGYSNTTAVYINGRIYTPAGFVGDVGSYSGRHCMFDITTNEWYPKQPNIPQEAPWPGGEPYAWSAAVAYPPFNGYFLTGGLSGAMPLTPGLPDPPPDWQPRNEMLFYQIGGTVNDPGSWTTLAPMQAARFAHTAVQLRLGTTDYICVVGGLTKSTEGNPQLLTGGECFHTTANNWSLTLPPLNTPRYNAGSAVGPDGYWYVFGGVNASGNQVALTERYDPASNSWVALDSRYNLGQLPATPPRSWPRGAFIGDSLWVTGGEWRTVAGLRVVNLVERLFMPSRHTFLPVVAQALSTSHPGLTFANALLIRSQQPQEHRFVSATDYLHVFYYDTAAAGITTIHLSQIPAGSDYNIHVYHDNKGRIVSGLNLGNQDELVSVSGTAQRYYIFVERVFPSPGADPHPQPYRLQVVHP
jgi:hypothetical protein